MWRTVLDLLVLNYKFLQYRPSQLYVPDVVFPASQAGSCSATCLLSNVAPMNRQGSHTVTMLFIQLLLNAGSLKVEHQHTLITYSHSNNLREI